MESSKAFVLITMDPSTSTLSSELRHIECVKEVYPVAGIYDFVVEVEAESAQKMREVITSRIRKLASVKTTFTMVVEQ